MDGKRPSFRERMQQLGRTTGLNRGPVAYLAEVATDLRRGLLMAEAVKQNEDGRDVRQSMYERAKAVAQTPTATDRETRQVVREAAVLLTEAAKLPQQPGEPTKDEILFAATVVKSSVADRIAAARERNAERSHGIERDR